MSRDEQMRFIASKEFEASKATATSASINYNYRSSSPLKKTRI